MDKFLEIVKSPQAIFNKKDDGTEVNYFLFPEFEVHENLVPAKTEQGWHRHQNIEEILVITDGEITVEVIDNDEKRIKNCSKGDVVRMQGSIHRLVNNQQNSCEFVVFRFVPQNKDTSQQIKEDKIEFSNDQIESLLMR